MAKKNLDLFEYKLPIGERRSIGVCLNKEEGDDTALILYERPVIKEDFQKDGSLCNSGVLAIRVKNQLITGLPIRKNGLKTLLEILKQMEEENLI